VTGARAAIVASVVSSLASVGLLLLVMASMVATETVSGLHAPHADTLPHPDSVWRFAALSAPLWIVGVVVEAAVCASVVSFLGRVRGELLPAAPGAGR
jgi:hypothetical protein